MIEIKHTSVASHKNGRISFEDWNEIVNVRNYFDGYINQTKNRTTSPNPVANIPNQFGKFVNKAIKKRRISKSCKVIRLVIIAESVNRAYQKAAEAINRSNPIIERENGQKVIKIIDVLTLTEYLEELERDDLLQYSKDELEEIKYSYLKGTSN